MSILSRFFNDDKKAVIGKVSGFIEDYVPKKVRRNCGLGKPSDLAKDSSGEQLSLDDSLFALGNGGASLLGPVPSKVEIVEASEMNYLGYSADTLLLDKIAIGFMDTTFYRLLQLNKADGIKNAYEKDTWYRFDQAHVNWEGLQTKTAANVIAHIRNNTDMNGYRGALAIDDSLYERTMGVHGGKSKDKVTEFLGTVYDHTDRKSRLGFRMMTAVWTNGDDTVPVSQCLLATRKEELREGSFEVGDCRTWEGKRRLRAITKGTDVMVQMVETAITAGIEFDDVLADTWFSKPAQAIAIKKLEVDLIAMTYKGNAKYGVLLPGKQVGKKGVEAEDLEWMTVKEIYSSNKKKRGVSRYLLSVDVWMKDVDGTLYPARLVFARNHSNRKQWVVFICTNMSLSENDILARYAFRWNVERYFKLEKSYLGLQDCHSTSYDALTCRMVIAALRFMFLSVQRFDAGDNRSLEQIFAQVKRQVVGYLVENAAIFVANLVFESVERVLKPTKEQMKELLLDFLENLPEAIGSRLDKSKVEAIA